MPILNSQYFRIQISDVDFRALERKNQDLEFIKQWLDYCFEQLDLLFGEMGKIRRIPIPITIEHKPGILAGGTGNGTLYYALGDYSEQMLRGNPPTLGIFAHELINLWTGETVTSCFPFNWWANGKSPFPIVVT